MRTGLAVFFALTLSLDCIAEGYPNMVGVWKGQVRVVESGTSRQGEVARGGMIISDVELTLTIEHQDGETFIGRSRSSRMASSDPSTSVWGTIRSNGKEGIFMTNTGGRGQVWFAESGAFEFCITNQQDALITAYCGTLMKQG